MVLYHLQNTQWAPHTYQMKNFQSYNREEKLRPQSSDETPFTAEELTTAVNKLKKRKAQGLDQNAKELFMLTDDHITEILLQHYNGIWTSGEVRPNWKEAFVVSIYEGKRTDTDPANYRPISLLNTVYKIFASILQARLARDHDDHLRNTQFGFRSKKGTKHPLLILRRAMEWSESTGPTMHHIFGLETSICSIDHNAMMIALERFEISARALQVLKCICYSPTFAITSSMGERTEGTVGSGIRQGCPPKSISFHTGTDSYLRECRLRAIGPKSTGQHMVGS